MQKEKIIAFLKTHPKLYYLYKCVKEFNNPEFVMDICRINECDRVLNFQQGGDLFPDKNIYYIYNNSDVRGLFSLIFLVLDALIIAERYNLVPVVQFGSNTLYHEKDMVNGSFNSFEYYYKPLSSVKVEEISSCYRVWHYKDAQRNSDYNKKIYVASQMLMEDDTKETYISSRANIYRKYMHLVPQVEEYINEHIKMLIGTKKLLGVHVRGTDFNAGYLNHAKVITLEQYLQETKKVMDTGVYEGIFLATDEEKALNCFKEEFGEKLFYYKDAFRSVNGVALHFSESNRKNHKYQLGLEVLRDVYSLASCEGLIAGFSNVSLAARVIKCANDEKYQYVNIINNGFNTTGKRFEKSRNKSI